MAATPEPFHDSIEHVLEEMKRLDLFLRRAVLVARHARASDTPDEFRGLVISEEHVDRLLDSVDFLGDIWKLDPAQAEEAQSIDLELGMREAMIRDRMQASAEAGQKLTLAQLAATCGLSPAEVDILLIALAPELEPRYETLYAYLQNDVTRKRPSEDLCLNLICRNEQEKIRARRLFSPDGPLVHFRLIELHEESYDRHPTLLRHFLRLNESVTRFLLERQPAQTTVAQLISAELTIDELESSAATRTELKNLAEALSHNGTEHAIIQLWGDGNAPLKESAEALAEALGKDLLFVDLTRLEPDPASVGGLIRDAALWGNLLVIFRGEADPGEASQDRAKRTRIEDLLFARIVESNIAVVLLSPDEPSGALGNTTHLWRVQIEEPDFDTRIESWRAALADSNADIDPARMADLFSYAGNRVEQTVSLARARAALRDPASPRTSTSDVLVAGRDLASPNLQRFAITIEPRFTWDDLVLPSDQSKQLRSLAARFEHRSIVHRNWDFGAKLVRGAGLSALFTGPSGTGKTTAAEVLASDLSMRLLQIDLATVVSKYIGETEKNLSAIFREAESSQSLLFFDEADALFGKRTDVKDAHDRYANIEVNYLLQRIEQYRGLVVLATNFQENIDDAFLRRMQFSVRFPFPDEAAREQIWRIQFPRKAPLSPEVNLAFLARQFKIPGGIIHNAALEAAFAAAQQSGADGPITMEHIIHAIKLEYQKQGKLVMKDDLGPYARAS